MNEEGRTRETLAEAAMLIKKLAVSHNSNGNWRRKAHGAATTSHIAKVIEQLAVFGATVPVEILDTFDRVRQEVNAAKHEEGHFATEEEARGLFGTVSV